MTISYPPRVSTQKLNHWRWMPAVAAIAAPKLSEWTAGIAAQCSFSADQMQVVMSMTPGSVQRYCDAYDTQTPGRKALDLGTVDIYVDPSSPSSATYPLNVAWKAEPTGFLALRAGYADDLAAAVGKAQRDGWKSLSSAEKHAVTTHSKTLAAQLRAAR